MSDMRFLAKQVIGYLGIFWPITLSLIAASIVPLVKGAKIKNHGFEASVFRSYLKMILVVPFFMSFLMVAFGSAYRWTGTPQLAAPTWPKHVILVLLIVQVFSSLFFAWKIKRSWFLSCSLFALQTWIAFIAAAVAEMSVMDNWIL
jgi:hypothetical protein